MRTRMYAGVTGKAGDSLSMSIVLVPIRNLVVNIFVAKTSAFTLVREKKSNGADSFCRTFSP
jgi:hypothetical protein